MKNLKICFSPRLISYGFILWISVGSNISFAQRDPASLQRDAKTEREETKNEDLTVTGIIEIEAVYSRNYSGVESSDITNATAQIDIEKKLNKRVTGRITFLHEDENSPDTKTSLIDEALCRVDFESGTYVQMGKMYVPFGSFRSEFISDPLTLEVAETNENAFLLGYQFGQFDLALYTFNGDTQKAGSADKVSTYGGAFSFENGEGESTTQASIYYINNILESDSLNTSSVLTDTNSNSKPDDLRSIVGAMGASLDFENSRFLTHLEYLVSAGKTSSQDLSWKGRGAQLQAYSIEMGMKYEISSLPVSTFAGYQKTEQALALSLANESWLLGSKIVWDEGIEFSYEFKYDQDYGVNDCTGTTCGTGGVGRTHSLQFALSF